MQIEVQDYTVHYTLTHCPKQGELMFPRSVLARKGPLNDILVRNEIRHSVAQQCTLSDSQVEITRIEEVDKPWSW